MRKSMYCKAGFLHWVGQECTHVVKQGMQSPGIPAKFEIPDEFYSEEAMAARREENREKYKPTRRPYHRERELVGNEALDMQSWA